MQKELYDSEVDWKEEKIKGENLRKIFSEGKRILPWMIISCIFCIILCYTYIYLTKKQYESNALILIKDDENKLSSNPKDLNLLQSMGLFQTTSNVDNELGIIKSFSLMENVVKELNLSFLIEDRKDFKKVLLYKATSPITIQLTNNQVLQNENYNLTLQNTYFEIRNKIGQIYKGAYDINVKLPLGNIIIHKSALFKTYINKPILLHVGNQESLTKIFQRALKADIENKNTSLIRLDIKNDDPYLCADILNQLINDYQFLNIEDHNKIIESTIAFISARLDSVSLELNAIEQHIEEFKKFNNIADLSTQSKALITGMNTSLEKESEGEVQLTVVNSLIKYMNDNKNHVRIIPASLTVQNTTLTNAIINYNNLLMERERILINYSPNSNAVINISNQIKELRNDLLNNLQSVKNSLTVSTAKISYQIDGINDKIREIPNKERTFLNYSRQQAIKQELYLFLLQKKEEAVISKSSTVSNCNIVDKARPELDPISPNATKIYSLGILLGTMIPFLINYLKTLFSFKIKNKEDVEKLTTRPIIGEISHVSNHYKIASTKYNSLRDTLKEQLRIVRSNIQFMSTERPTKTILINSSIPEEGKSFITINLASILALSGKKVIILEMDLRRPTISSHFSINNRIGFSNYIIGDNPIEDYIVSTPTQNISLLPSGAIAPNPTELLLSDKVTKMIYQLEATFDYILIDTAPNVVADAKVLIKYADMVLYVVRCYFTDKEALSDIDKIYSKKPVGIVINDIKSQSYNKYNYQYSSN